MLQLSENRALVLGEPCSGFKDHNQRGGGKWCMYHTDETHFYQPDKSKVTGRLLKEKSKLTFVDVLIKIFIACLLKEVKNSLFSFRHSYLRHLSRRFKKL